MEEVKFKYSPYWLLPFSGLVMYGLGFGLYLLGDSLSRSDYKLIPFIFILCSLQGSLTYYLLSIVYKMLTGIPAIILSEDFFISSTLGLSIDYADIIDVTIRPGGKTTILGISLNNTEKYFNSPIKRMVYKLNSIFTADDLRINLDFIRGNNETIVQTINAYRDKHEGL
ncbi:MAG: hypothetical protein ACXVA2_12080 [Mucilaginibacter sp.]